MKYRRYGLVGAAALSLFSLGALAQSSPGRASAPFEPSAAERARLCDTCAFVRGTVVEKRKGKPTVVGTAGGAVVGGMVGRSAGDGSVLATGAGAVAGAMIGREIEKQVKKHKVWVTTVITRDGQTQSVEAAADPGWQPGEQLKLNNGAWERVGAATKVPLAKPAPSAPAASRA